MAFTSAVDRYIGVHFIVKWAGTDTVYRVTGYLPDVDKLQVTWDSTGSPMTEEIDYRTFEENFNKGYYIEYEPSRLVRCSCGKSYHLKNDYLCPDCRSLI